MTKTTMEADCTTPNCFRLGSGAALRSSTVNAQATATSKRTPWLFVNAYMLFAVLCTAAADDYTPPNSMQPMVQNVYTTSHTGSVDVRGNEHVDTAWKREPLPSLRGTFRRIVQNVYTTSHAGSTDVRGNAHVDTAWNREPLPRLRGPLRRTLPQGNPQPSPIRLRPPPYIPQAITLAWAVIVFIMVMHMYPGQNNQNGPPWDPAGNIPFRDWMREVGAWLNVTSARLSPTAQAAAIQLGLRGTARTFAMAIPPEAITFGASINGVRTDPVTYLIYTLGNRYEALEDERTMLHGTSIIDFRGRHGERIDSLLTRFDMARHEAASVGAGMENYHTLYDITTCMWSQPRSDNQPFTTDRRPNASRPTAI